MAIRYVDPLDALLTIQQALERRLSNDWLGDTTSGAGAYPPTNVFQKGDDFVAVIELPGIDKSSLNIQATGNRIRIAGRKAIHFPDKVSVHRRERLSGEFDRTLTVPVQVDAEGMRADYSNGVLSIFLPRAASEKPRSITIN